jgi:hypothetical protein
MAASLTLTLSGIRLSNFLIAFSTAFMFYFLHWELKAALRAVL